MFDNFFCANSNIYVDENEKYWVSQVFLMFVESEVDEFFTNICMHFISMPFRWLRSNFFLGYKKSLASL